MTKALYKAFAGLKRSPNTTSKSTVDDMSSAVADAGKSSQTT